MAGIRATIAKLLLDGPQRPRLATAVGPDEGGDAGADRHRAAGLSCYDVERDHNIDGRSCHGADGRGIYYGNVRHGNLLRSKFVFITRRSHAVRPQ